MGQRGHEQKMKALFPLKLSEKGTSRIALLLGCQSPEPRKGGRWGGGVDITETYDAVWFVGFRTSKKTQGPLGLRGPFAHGTSKKEMAQW